MIDELELSFEERADKGRHRRGARRKPRKGGGAKTVVALMLALLLLGGLAGGVWYGFDRIQGLFTVADYDGTGTAEQVQIEVKAGDTITDIANTLTTAGVVKSAKAFVDAAAAETRSENIQPGFYTVRKQMSGESALSMLLDLKNKNTKAVTIREGLTAIQTYKKLSEATGVPVADFQAAAKDPEALGIPSWWFERKDGKKGAKSVEGFLFPDTYEFDPKPTADKILRTMISRFLAVTGDELKFAQFVEANRGGITPYEALIVASLAQAEAGHPDDLGKVARVAYNRLYLASFPTHLLQFDVTLNYGLEIAGKPTKASKDMTQADYDNASNKYNTHLYKGLTPTPINSPGSAALKGAMDPPAGKWIFFVAIDKQGHSAFAETDAQHEENKRRAEEAGII
jgi:UPF0755 protein